MFSRAEFKYAAKGNLTGNWSYLAGLTVIIIILSAIAGFILGMIPIIGAILLIFISTPFNFSEMLITIKLYKSEEIRVGDVFSGFNFTLKAVGLYLWVVLWTWLWSLLLIIPGIIKSYSYSMSFFCLLNNPELTIREAMRESIRLTSGFKGDLFILDLSWLGWEILTIFTCGIGLLFLNPYIIQTKYITFRFLKEHSDGFVEPEEEIPGDTLY